MAHWYCFVPAGPELSVEPAWFAVPGQFVEPVRSVELAPFVGLAWFVEPEQYYRYSPGSP